MPNLDSYKDGAARFGFLVFFIYFVHWPKFKMSFKFVKSAEVFVEASWPEIQRSGVGILRSRSGVRPTL